ncbi:hypothetical protein KA005_21770, partial [bacterium]|nr:hypothetical protein [bacterium]
MSTKKCSAHLGRETQDNSSKEGCNTASSGGGRRKTLPIQIRVSIVWQIADTLTLAPDLLAKQAFQADRTGAAQTPGRARLGARPCKTCLPERGGGVLPCAPTGYIDAGTGLTGLAGLA